VCVCVLLREGGGGKEGEGKGFAGPMSNCFLIIHCVITLACIFLPRCVVWYIVTTAWRGLLECVIIMYRGEMNVDIFAADEIASGVSPSTEQLLASPSHTMSISDFKADVSTTCLLTSQSLQWIFF